MCCQIIKVTFSAADVLPPQRKNAGKLRSVNKPAKINAAR
jgi:hypothetical protein